MSDRVRHSRLLGELIDALLAGVAPARGMNGDITRIVEAAGDLPLPSWPDDLVGRPCPEHPALWNARGLSALLHAHAAAPVPDDAMRARMLYHARWLGHYLGVADGRHLPGISIVIPIFNNADMIGAALESCIAQTWRSREIVVVDDGSTDDLDRVLSAYAGRLTLIRQPNSGPSRARRVGIAAASGDLIHFLDSDDLLLPGCLAGKAAAFAAVPDAELCFGGIVGYDPESLRRVFTAYENPDGGPTCPTTDLVRTIARRLPFLPSNVMIPRWVLLETRAFHEDLRRADDIRLWFRLAQRGSKVLGLTGETVVRRYRSGSLGQQEDEPSCSHAIAVVMNLLDLVADPALWHSAFHYLNALRLARVWEEVNLGRAAQLDDRRTHLIQAVASLGDGERRQGRSPLPLLALLLAGLDTLGDEAGTGDHAAYGFHRELDATAQSAATTAAALTDADVAAWLAPEHAGAFGADVGLALARLAGIWRGRRGGQGLRDAVRILLQLANPVFDHTAFARKTLAEVRAKPLYAAPPGTGRDGRTSRGLGRAFRAWRPAARRRAAIELLDGLVRAQTSAMRRRLRDDRAAWRCLEAAVADRPDASPHLERLKGLLMQGEVPPDHRQADLARLQWHAKALARGLGSGDRRHAPTVAMVMPAAGTEGGLVETVESGLRQTGHLSEIIVVGDSGDEAAASALAAYPGKARFIGKVRPAPVAGWNAAVDHSRSDFILPVSAGSVLAPEAIATHLSAFDDAPAVDVTWSRSGPATADMLSALAEGNGPHFGEWMAPRWVLLATGPFDAWLGDAAVDRYMMRLAAEGFRVSAIDPGLVTHRPPLRPGLSDALAGGLGLADLFGRPQHWRHLFAWASTMSLVPEGADMSARDRILAALVQERLEGAIGHVAAGGGPAMAAMVLALAGLGSRPADSAATALTGHLVRAASTCSALTAADGALIERLRPPQGVDARLRKALAALGRGGDGPSLPRALTDTAVMIAKGLAGSPSGGSAQEARVPASS